MNKSALGSKTKNTDANPASDEYKDWRILWRCYRYLRPYWKLAVGGYILLLINSVLLMLNPQFIRWIIDRGIGGPDIQFLAWSVLGLLALTLMRGGFAFLQGRWIEQGSQNVAYDLRNDIHQKLANLSFSYHDRTETGQLLARAIQDVERIRFLTGRATMHLVGGAVSLIVTLIVLLSMNLQLALLTMLTLPLLFFQAYRYSHKARPMWRELQQQMAVLTTVLEQNLRGARIVKGFAQEDAEIERFKEQNNHWFDLAAHLAWLRAVNGPLMTLVSNIGMIFIIWYGGRLVVGGRLTVGELVAFTTYIGQLAGPVRRIGHITPVITQAIACGERIFEILDAESEVQELPDAVALPPIQGHVRFNNVSFAYFGRHRVLEHIDLEAQPGQIIALLGKTGSGKSTIINLIPRFYDTTEGCITIDGYDIREVTLESLRAQIGIVLQQTTLFAASVRENIAFGHPDASEGVIIETAKAAQAHEFIMQMPYGYDTMVGERGSTLSGGQKQRIAIARALLKDPRILILDDAMSSVDTETERQIQQALEYLMQGRTSFVIAQRLSTVRAANQILVLDNGDVVARGTHESLLRTSGLYAEIYNRQLRPQEQLPPLKMKAPATSEAPATSTSSKAVAAVGGV